MFKKIFRALQYNYVYYSKNYMYCSTLKYICSTNFKGVTALFVFWEAVRGFDEVRRPTYNHPLHRKVLKHFIYIYDVIISHYEVVPSLNHVIVVCFVSSCLSDSVSSASAYLHVFDEVKKHPYDHPLHQEVLKHFIYIEDGSVIHLEVVSGSTMS
jgi:hypothetical protein